MLFYSYNSFPIFKNIRISSVLFITYVVTSIFFCFASYANDIDNQLDVNDPFLIKGLKIQVDSGNLEDSRDMALDLVAEEGFNRLVERISVSEGYQKVKGLQNSINFEDYVDSYSIVSQRMTSHSYMATLDVKFKEDKVKAFLNNLGARYGDSYSNSSLIIPILYSPSSDKVKYKIWGKGEWQDAWGLVPAQVGLMKFQVIVGELNDVEVINHLTILLDPYEKFYRALEQHNSQDLIIIWAELVNTHLEVNLRFLGQDYNYNKFTEYNKKVNESDKDFYIRVVNDLLLKIDSSWKGEKSFKDPVVYYSNVKVMVKKPSDWNIIRNILSSIEQIKNYKITANSIEAINLELDYTVAPPTLSTILLQKGIKVVKKGEDLFLELKK